MSSKLLDAHVARARQPLQEDEDDLPELGVKTQSETPRRTVATAE